MLTPLESGAFDSVAGLPLHPLIVHFAIVLLPLAALGLVVLVIAPKWADRFGWLALGVLAVGTGAAFVAKESGEQLSATVGEPRTHASWGNQLPLLAVALLVLASVWFVLHRRGRRTDSRRSPGATLVGVVAAVLALVVTAVTVVVGHTGAQAAWGDVVSADDGATASASPSPVAPTANPTTPSATASGTRASSYTIADVAEHSAAASCWSAINGKVYDLTDWIGQHPGGRRAILRLCGRDGSSGFNAQHGSRGRAAAELKQFLLGTLN